VATTAAETVELGVRIRRLREERGLRLEDVARRAGYTKGFLSKIENGRASPPIATLMRVAQALQIDPGVFFSEGSGKAADANATVHVKPDARALIENAAAGPGYSYWALAAQRTHKFMQPFLLTVHPDEFDPTRTFEHPGEEFIYILSGSCDYRVGDETFQLGPGDSLYFDATRPHAPQPKGEPVTFIAVFYAPPGRVKKEARGRSPRKS
jgi:transcriptional regulator with XRE-family HTH domain